MTLFFEKIAEFLGQLQVPWAPLLGLAVFMLLGFALPDLLRAFRGVANPIPTSHKIAVIGLPRAGKTTLITALFELIQRGVDLPDVRLHGLNTIKTVNQYIARLHSGDRIGPTTEDEIFIFRFSYFRKKYFVKQSYDVEIADFPGEYTGKMSSDDAQPQESSRRKRKAARISKTEPDAMDFTLFDQEFFSWIASSREYLFLIDLSAIYSDENPRRAIAELSARIRTSWQVIEDAASERGIGSARHRVVHLVFTKSDCLLPLYRADTTLRQYVDSLAGVPTGEDDANKTMNKIRLLIGQQGESDNLTHPTTEHANFVQLLRDENNGSFSDLISFFRSRVRGMSIIYSSMILLEQDGTRLGIRNVLRATLP